MLIGYGAVEVAKFRRARERGRTYHAGHLWVRLINGLLAGLCVCLMVGAISKSPGRETPWEYWVAPILLGAVLVLVFVDLLLVGRQHRAALRQCRTELIEQIAPLLAGQKTVTRPSKTPPTMPHSSPALTNVQNGPKSGENLN